MKIEFGDLLVLADRQCCRFLSLNPETQQRHLHALHQFGVDKRMGHQLGRDKPGRTFSRVTGGRTAYEQRDPRSSGEHHFFVAAAIQIEVQFNQGNFQRIVIAGDPEVLILLKAALKPDVLAKVYTEINKNYIHKTIAELDALLNQV